MQWRRSWWCAARTSGRLAAPAASLLARWWHSSVMECFLGYITMVIFIGYGNGECPATDGRPYRGFCRALGGVPDPQVGCLVAGGCSSASSTRSASSWYQQRRLSAWAPCCCFSEPEALGTTSCSPRRSSSMQCGARCPGSEVRSPAPRPRRPRRTAARTPSASLVGAFGIDLPAWGSHHSEWESAAAGGLRRGGLAYSNREDAAFGGLCSAAQGIWVPMVACSSAHPPDGGLGHLGPCTPSRRRRRADDGGLQFRASSGRRTRARAWAWASLEPWCIPGGARRGTGQGGAIARGSLQPSPNAPPAGRSGACGFGPTPLLR